MKDYNTKAFRLITSAKHTVSQCQWLAQYQLQLPQIRFHVLIAELSPRVFEQHLEVIFSFLMFLFTYKTKNNYTGRCIMQEWPLNRIITVH